MSVDYDLSKMETRKGVSVPMRSFTEGICVWILAAYFFIHLLMFIFHQENFSNLFNTKRVNLLASCHVATNLKNHVLN